MELLGLPGLKANALASALYVAEIRVPVVEPREWCTGGGCIGFRIWVTIGSTPVVYRQRAAQEEGHA
jgi:hypothetical protein